MKSSFIALLLLAVTVMHCFGHMWEKMETLRRSKRRWVLSTIELQEEDKGPFPKEATKLFNDQEINYKLKYFISGEGVTEPPMGVFSIDDQTGVVYVNKPIDREKNPTFHVRFDVLDRITNAIVDRTLAFDVAIKDINDNAPVFDRPVINADVKETTKGGLLPINIRAMDADEEDTDNSKISMRVVLQEPSSPSIGLKHLNGTDLWQLTLTGCFDYDKEKKYKVLIEARDHGRPTLSSTATVNINILDGNTHLPVFTQTEYKAEAMELTTNQEILRMKVEDKDTPNTTASQAKFTIVKGNEEGNYKIVRDPKTNEGVLIVVQANDYEKTTLANLQIAVENEDALFVCDSDSQKTQPKPQTVNVAVAIKDANDPPEFKKVRNEVYQTEESPPGVRLYTPEVTDEDSDVSKLRYEKVTDPENYVSVDSKTGVVTTVKKMDRESPHVVNNTYAIVMRAIDDGQPPSTGTATVLIHLNDINDNVPYLINNTLVLCGNRESKVEIVADDKDGHPFSGPFVFSLRGNDPNVKSRWKLDPDIGNSATLVSLKSLAYGNYSVPLRVLDHQGKGADEDLSLVVCNCGKENMCQKLMSPSASLGGKGALTLICGLLLLPLLLCLLFFCVLKKHMPTSMQEEGSQTMIKYNEECGGTQCKTDPELLMAPSSPRTITDGPKYQTLPLRPFSQTSDVRHYGNGMTLPSHARGMDVYSEDVPRVQYVSGVNSMRNGTLRSSRIQSVFSDSFVYGFIQKRLLDMEQNSQEHLEYCPREYVYEGEGNSVHSLDKLSLGNHDDSLNFLQNLGPKFNKLGGICRHDMEKKK
ncbi:cadherin-like protein 26 [Brienomyrus brachyistius]|uniref:cadherin-like protein 26 n=1 Tax=Brienomyrus brachyistius TaxID=42636 RepID=UPI0020B2C266|nr:cadherin-like protein 26 [Brienomyrus brachyistius]XP_048874468.1 cadherin-like protein 26 [Brienomyrus brachyistius]